MTDTQLTTEALRDATPTPIARLNPEITDPDTRVVEGVITIIWPFSIVTKSIAFILAEPDFRLRRENGQVRLRFHGASAQAIADAKLGGGDEVRLSLLGVKWEKNEMETQLAGSTLEWQIEFTSRLFLSVQRAGEGEEELRVIDIDVAEADAPVTNGVTSDLETAEHQSTNDTAIPIPQSPEISLPAKRPASSNFESQELSSPAFLKRARLSYGSLFEGGFDIFDEPQSKKKKTKRRSRFSLPANSWRYNSRSPSPEVEEVDQEPDSESDQEQENNNVEVQQESADVPMPTPTRPAMVDGGCQTDNVDFTPMASVQVLAEARPEFGFPYATPTPLPRSRPEDLAQPHPLNFEVGTPAQQNPLLQDNTGFHAPAHLDPSLEFTFGAPQSNMFAGPQFSTAQDGSIGVSDDRHFPSAEQYPATFLENQSQTSTGFHSSHDDMETQEPQRPHVHFEAEPQFYPPFEVEDEPAQPQRPEWQTSQFTAVNNLANPSEFINSSPLREQAEPDEEHSASDRSSSAPNEPERELGLQEVLDKRLEYDREDEDEEPPTEEEGFFRDGGDQPGDDYDLRNYDRAHADDDDVVGSSEESPDIGTDDPDAQIMNPEEEDEEEDDDGDIDEDVGNYDERAQYGEYAGELREGEYLTDDDMYDDVDEEEEESEEDEHERYPRHPPAPREPVFISLLSDSESEDEDEPEPKPQSQPEPHRLQEPRPVTEPESEPQSEEDSASESEVESDEETGSEAERPAGPPVELEQAPEVDEPQSPEEPQSPVDSEQSMEDSDRDKDLAEDTIPVGQEPPSEDRMEVDGDQSPEPPRGSSPESQSSLQGDQRTHPVDREENESAPVSIERGDPANEHHEEPDKENIDSTVVELEVAPATPQGSEGHEQVEEEIQVSEVVQVEEIVAISGDAIEVDDTEEVHFEEKDQTAGIVTDSANGTADVVQPTGSTPAENATTGMETHEESINVEATNVVEVLAEIVVAEGPGSAPSLASNVHDQTTSQVEEDATNANPETQGSGPTGSPDATLQETFQLATGEHRPLDRESGAQSGNGEGYEETNNDQQVFTNTPFSPPATQVSQTQISKDVDAVLFSQASTITSTHNPDGNLPTPHDTQQDVEMSAHYPADEYHGIQDEEDEADADTQIMAEFLQRPPERLEGIQNANPAAIGTSPTKAEPSGVLNEEKPLQDEQGSGGRSPARSLRKRGYKPARSSDWNRPLPPDPSISLAREPVPYSQEDDMRSFHSQSAPRITRSRADPPDPSIQLARASPIAEDPKQSSASPTGTLRVTRSMTDHDPSIALALSKGSTPTKRQTRRQYTPEVPHRETRASSRGLLKSDSPDVPEALLHSPSVASSTVEDETANALKLQLLKSLRTSMPEYLSLKTLRGSLNRTVDILAVATTKPDPPQRPKGGPRDYMLSLNLTDPSSAPTSVIVANLFRPHLSSLPVVQAGDVVLLRRVLVVSMKNRGFGVRTGDSSAWAVFEKDDREMLPQIKGPPVETSDDEVKYAEGLRRWWSLLDEKSMGKIDAVSDKIVKASKEHKEP